MKIHKVGFLTLGQSPRDDVMCEIVPLLNPRIECVQYGLLDDLCQSEINAIKPAPEETPLVSRLKGGCPVLLSEYKVSQLLTKAIALMKARMHVEAVGILCTHEFPRKEYSLPTVFPFASLRFLLQQVLEVGTLGVVVPLESQMEMAKKKWGKQTTFIEAKSPYAEGKSWEKIAECFARRKVHAVVLDCIGYTMMDRQAVQNAQPLPTLLPRAILAYALNQLF